MTDVIDLLRAADPAAHDAPTDEERDRMDRVLDARLAGLPTGAAAAGPPRRRARRPLLLAAFPTTALAAVLGALLLAGGGGTTAFRLEDATAAQALDRFRAAAAQSAADAGGGRYAYTRTLRYISHMRPKQPARGLDGGTFVTVVPQTEEAWVDDDGRGVLRLRDDAARTSFPTAEDRAAAQAAGPLPPVDQTSELRRFTVAGLTVRELRALPAEPGALAAALNDGDAPSSADWKALLPRLAPVLQTPLTPAPVRDAGYRLLQQAPGASIVPDVEDPTGRHGVGIAYGDAAWDVVLVFDPQTGAPMASRSIGKQELPGRTITDWTLQQAAGRTDDAPTPDVEPPRTCPPTEPEGCVLPGATKPVLPGQPVPPQGRR